MGKTAEYKRRKIIRLYEQQEGLCFYCKSPMALEPRPADGKVASNLATIEHLTPRSRGGTLRDSNTVAACYQCNNDRGDGRISQHMRAKGPQARVVWQDA